MLQGFKAFIMRGNLVELAVAVIIATAFAAVVAAFTNVILTLVSKIFGGSVSFDQYAPADIPVGAFLTALVGFLIVAAVVYFFVVVPYNTLRERMSKGEEPAPPSADTTLLTEIRDLLAAQAGMTTATTSQTEGSITGQSPTSGTAGS